MRRTLTLSLMFCAITIWQFSFAQFASAQANVNESLETAIVYVDGALGSDSNPGTQALPFQTVGKAASVANANNRASIGTHIFINPGAYRESISLGNSPSATSLPITFEATAKAKVRISGADVWTGWQPSSGNPAIYTHAWPYAWGLCPRATSGPIEQEINLRREMIFVNTVMLTQVLALNQMTPGTFFVDETNARVYIYPALKTNISTATIEVATRDALFSVYNRTNIVLRGLRFEQSNACRYNDAVKFNNGGNILVESDGFNRNNAGAFGINGVDFFTVRNSVANHNGERGFKSYKAKDGVWVNDEADYNNWRGAQGGIYGWAGGGFYFYDQHNNTISNIRVFYNPSHGVHWDTDITNVAARGMIASYNLRGGLIMEKAEGPVTIANSYVCFNSPLLGFTDGGMMVRASNFVSLTGNTLADNSVDQLAFIGIMGGTKVNFTNYETGQNYSQVNANITMKYNTIVALPGEQLFYDFDQSGAAWTAFLSTLVSNHNSWWNGTDPQPFTVPEPAWFSKTDWPGWLTTSGQDTHSKFAAPTSDPTIPCQVKADGADFWFINFETGGVTVAPGSPVKLTMFLIPLGGFNGQTSFAAYGVDQIPGASAGWSQTSLAGSGTSVYTISTSSTTPVGNYPVTLTAVSGNLTRTLTAFVTVAVPTPPAARKQ
jgi:hypothetical protein